MTTKTIVNDLGVVPLNKWNDYFEFPSASALRGHIQRNTNNIKEKCLNKVGNRIYIKVEALKEWLGNK